MTMMLNTFHAFVGHSCVFFGKGSVWVLCESRSVVSDSLQPYALYSLWTSPGQNTGVGTLSLLQRVVSTQGSNPGLPHCRRILTSWATREVHLSPLPSFKLGCFHIVESKSSLCILVTGSLGFPGGSVVRNPPPSLGGEDAPEKEMATHSSILVWKIPWVGEPGRLPLMESQESQAWLRGLNSSNSKIIIK